MPIPIKDSEFLKIYFLASCEERVITRWWYNFIKKTDERAIEGLLKYIIENCNQLIKLFKNMSPRFRNDNYKIFISLLFKNESFFRWRCRFDPPEPFKSCFKCSHQDPYTVCVIHLFVLYSLAEEKSSMNISCRNFKFKVKFSIWSVLYYPVIQKNQNVYKYISRVI
jgi:hypothetical protein